MSEVLMVQVQEGVCRVCGCSDLHACVNDAGDACFWIEEDLCSNCASPEAQDCAKRAFELNPYIENMSQGDSGIDQVVRECLKCQGPTKVDRVEEGVEIEKCQNPDCGFMQAGIPGMVK